MKRDKETKKLSYTHTQRQSFLYVQGKHTPEKERKKIEKKKREREREREPKKPKITPKTLNHQIEMAPPKKKKQKTLA
jgi:hypothetical protein